MGTTEPLRQAIRVLVVEDEPQYFSLIEAMVEDFEGGRFELVNEHRLADARARLEYERFDLVLLDLGLPDSRGLGSLEELNQQQALPPTVVLTSLADEEAAVGALRQGAQDYLVKNRIDGPVLVRALAYALERDKLQRELEEARLEALQRELVFLRRITDDSRGSTGKLENLRNDYPPILARYIAKVRAGEARPADEIEAIALRLANRRARARDVVQIHLAALDQLTEAATAKEKRRLAEDARLALIEVLGNLADLYGLTDFGGS